MKAQNSKGWFVFEIQIDDGMRHCVKHYGNTIADAESQLPDNCQNFGIVECYATSHEADFFLASQ